MNPEIDQPWHFVRMDGQFFLGFIYLEHKLSKDKKLLHGHIDVIEGFRVFDQFIKDNFLELMVLENWVESMELYSKNALDWTQENPFIKDLISESEIDFKVEQFPHCFELFW